MLYWRYRIEGLLKPHASSFIQRRDRSGNFKKSGTYEWERIMTGVPVKVGQLIELEIDNYGHEGEGVGRFQNFTVFVPGMLRGERVKTRIVEVRKNFARGQAVAVLQAAPERRTPECPIYAECGGCQLQHLDYPAQLQLKREQVVNAVERIGGLTGITIHPTLGMERPRQYRNKLQYPFGISDGAVVVGCFRQGTHQIVPVQECLIQHPLHNRVLDSLRELVVKHRIPIYDERSGKGLLRHVLLKNGFATGEAMVVLVTHGERFPEGQAIAAQLAAAHPEIKSVVQNINRTRGNVILGRENRTLWGNDGIIEELDGLRFRISANAFFQVNPLQTVKLYQKAVEYAALAGSERVVDAYCGVGSLTLFLARRAAEVFGIEVVPEAIRDAKENAALNGLGNVRFLVGETETVLPRLVREGRQFEVAVVDPPRAGCAESVLETLAAVKVKRIVYVSCNPSTLARDLKRLAELGYETKEIQPVDMFPQTYHVESIVLMSRL